MAFNPKGFKTITHIGTPDIAGGVGTNCSLHAYVTNDDAAAVETSNYFNTFAARLKKGDQIQCSLNVDATAALRTYVVASVTAGVVAITASQATAIA